MLLPSGASTKMRDRAMADLRGYGFSAAAAKLLQSCPTLCNPIDGSHQAPPSMGFSRQEYWSGLALPAPMPSLKGVIVFGQCCYSENSSVSPDFFFLFKKKQATGFIYIQQCDF